MGILKQENALAKINRPKIAGVVLRKRLFRLLDANRKKSAIWIAGPGGSGKTTLVSTWLDLYGLPCIWYRVDSGDGDPAAFFHYLGLAAMKAAPRIKRPLPPLTPEYLPALPVFTRRYFEDLGGRLKSPHVIVFDNYQDAPPVSRFHETVQTGISALPDGVFVMIMSRSEPPEEFARLRANKRLARIGWEEMRFTLDETCEIARLHGRKRRDPRACEYLHRTTGGWAAGIALMLESSGQERPRSEGAFPADRSGIFEYFAAELLAKLGPETRDLLLKTSVLPQVAPGVADDLCGIKNSDALLAALSRNHVFTTRLSHGEATYQYHPLFQEFLMNSAEKIFGAAGLRRLRGRSAGLLERAGRAEDAIDLYLKASEWTDADRLICAAAPAILSQGRNEIISGWIRALPAERLDLNPYLLYWLAASLIPAQPAKSLECFERAFSIFREQGDRTGIFLSWCGVIVARTFMRDFSHMIRWHEILKGLLRDDPSYPSKEIEIQVSLTLFSAVIFVREYDEDLQEIIDRAYTFLNTEPITDVNLYFMTVTALLGYFLYLGDYTRAGNVLDIMRRSERPTPFFQIVVNTYESFYMLCTNRLEECIQIGNEAVINAEKSGVHFWDAHNYTTMISAALSKGDEKLINEYDKKLLEITDRMLIIDHGYYGWAKAWKAFLACNYTEAIRHQAHDLEIIEGLGIILQQAVVHLGMAMILTEAGRHDEAEQYLNKGYQMASRMNSALFLFMYFIAKANGHFLRNEESEGLESLKEAMTLGKTNNIENTFYWHHGIMSRLCARALEAGIEADYARGLIRKRNLVPEASARHIEDWPWPIRIQTLGRFRIQKDDRPLTFARKVQKKPIEMLKAVIAYGGRDIPEERLADALWPDAEGDSAKKSLATTLHRLRRLLKDDEAVLVEDGQVSLNERRVWLDSLAFEQLAKKAEPALGMGGGRSEGKSNAHDALVAAEKAITLYHGEFLPGDMGAAWNLTPRERLIAKYHRLVLGVGSHWTGAGDLERALECYERGLQLSELSEELYQRQMELLIRTGRRSEAAAMYHRCKKVLAARLGIEPSRKTEEIYASLRKNAC